MSDLVKTFADLAWVTVISAPKVPQIMRADLEGIQEVRINNAVDVRSATGPHVIRHPSGRPGALAAARSDCPPYG